MNLNKAVDHQLPALLEHLRDHPEDRLLFADAVALAIAKGREMEPEMGVASWDNILLWAAEIMLAPPPAPA